MADSNYSQLVTLKGLNQVWAATRSLYEKSLDRINYIYTPAKRAGDDGEDEEGHPVPETDVPESGRLITEVNRLDKRIDDLDLEAVTQSGYYISSVSQSEGKVSASKTQFDQSFTYNNATNNAPTSQAIVDFLATVEFYIRNHSDYQGWDDGTPVKAQYDPSTNKITLMLPKKIYGAAFN